MATPHAINRELTFKIVFYGPGRSGKTSSLQLLYEHCPPERRGKLVHLPIANEATRFFDFLPLRIPKFGNSSVRLQLFSVPGQVHSNSTRKLILTGAHGIVFIADSDRTRADANVESLDNLKENLKEQKRTLQEIPHLFQYNKRDLSSVISEQELNQNLNEHKAPTVLSIANQGIGVVDTLHGVIRSIFKNFEGGLSLPIDLHAFFSPNPHQNTAESAISTTQFFDSSQGQSFSFSSLWGTSSRALASELETAITTVNFLNAAHALQLLVNQCLSEASIILPSAHSLSATAIVALLGLSVSRYSSLCRLLDKLAHGETAELPSLLAAYAFVIELRLACLDRQNSSGSQA